MPAAPLGYTTGMDLTTTPIGYLGLGIMGRPMALNLLRAGREVLVYNRTASKTRPLVEAGATAVHEPAELLQRGARVVCLNVTDTPDVEALVRGTPDAPGLLAHASPGVVFIDHSTISPNATRALADACAAQGVHFVDAPVSGGDVGAAAGTLSVMVGCDDGAVFDACRPLFEIVGGSVVHLGAAGSGQACKACNQVAVANALQGVVESIALARSLGLDVGQMLDVVAGGAGGSWQLTNLGPRIAAADDAPGFMIDLMLKDLRLVLEAAAEGGVDAAATPLATARFERVQQPRHGRSGTPPLRHPATSSEAHDGPQTGPSHD